VNAAYPEQQVFLRPMQTRDVQGVVKVERKNYLFPWSHKVFADCLSAGYCCRVLQTEVQVIGYGLMSIGAGESHILNICVDPEWHRRGLASGLLAHLLVHSIAENSSEVFLEVRPSNTPALELYKKFDFSKVGKRRGYYPKQSGREDAYVLKRSLEKGQKDFIEGLALPCLVG
jgi:ribosomal-protein-alanine N-acetyltransferase